MQLKTVIRNKDNPSQYLTQMKVWATNKDRAWEYTTDLVFMHAKDYGGIVYLRLPTGREIEVSKEDFAS